MLGGFNPRRRHVIDLIEQLRMGRARSNTKSDHPAPADEEQGKDMALVGRLRQCAEIAGSGDELARRAAIPRRTLEYYLAGDTDPKAKRLTAIVEATGVSGHWLLTGRGPKLADEAQTSLKRLADSIDAGRLGSALSAVEQCLIAMQRDISAEQRARIVMLTYEQIQNGRAPEETEALVRQLVELSSN